MKLTPAFFDYKSTIMAARDLLGKKIVHETENERYEAYITETEAYLGKDDEAAHSYGNRLTKRTRIMFQSPGHIYMYQMHQQVLLNIITMPEGVPEAVLIRAVEPVHQLAEMSRNRGGRTGREISNGPGKLTQALRLTMQDYGKTIFNSNIWLEEGKIPQRIESTVRIGIPNKRLATFYPLRFTVQGNPFLSGKKGLMDPHSGWRSLPVAEGTELLYNEESGEEA
ncbi:DNA-3-methyladenine glycosylase [Listeria costaricensis]|uniref:DNA-3-methyladenine glycosylase n=1 Tax=Listeria costaricensis TaxID=2026604 RepID=UPI000C06F081|nr:DNA-3-methyladenine glycosylase [Listeria costaricensis]